MIKEEIGKRRTFAIISHPDAGKTTLSEKLLLYGGAIQRAGIITKKANRSQTVSDWMDFERARGISITSSALKFEYRDTVYNLLDTPGHEDFSEDTYRVLTAVDSAVMLLDCVKGVEPQTVKLFKVCKERGIPIFTFINKMDRPGQSPFDLLDDIENTLGILPVPMTWPIGDIGDFKGVYDRLSGEVFLYERTAGGQWKAPMSSTSVEDESLAEMLSESDYERLKEEMELVTELAHEFDDELFQEGELTPVYFGCAMTNFGIEHFLDRFTKNAPCPGPLRTSDGPIPPEDKNFSAFVYKVQANMDPMHRDRVAFVRVATGKFEKNMSVKHLRTGKKVKLSFPYRIFGQKREIIEEAWPGDIVGLVNPGTFKVGDVLSGSKSFKMLGFPRFAPEIFGRVSLLDQTHGKSFRKGVVQLGEEGVIQLLNDPASPSPLPTLAAVGELQLEVFKDRMKAEYRCDCRIERLPYGASRWLASPLPNPDFPPFTVMEDELGFKLALFRNEWHIQQVAAQEPDIVLLTHPPE